MTGIANRHIKLTSRGANGLKIQGRGETSLEKRTRGITRITISGCPRVTSSIGVYGSINNTFLFLFLLENTEPIYEANYLMSKFSVHSLLTLILFQVSVYARPNVVYVMTDDQGYGEISVHGNPILNTPHMDRLHGQSIRLSDFHAAPMCTPSRGQLLTGLDAARNGAINVSSGRTLLRAELPTMANFFQDAGYSTGIFGKWHQGDNYPFRPEDRGFDETLWFPSSHINSAGDWWDNDYFELLSVTPCVPLPPLRSCPAALSPPVLLLSPSCYDVGRQTESSSQSPLSWLAPRLVRSLQAALLAVVVSQRPLGPRGD